MKKMLMILCVLILCVSSVLGLSLVDSTPTDGSTQLNNEVDFWLEANDTMTTAFVWIDNGVWTQYTMNCTGTTECDLTQDVSSWEDYLNYSFYFTSEGNNRPPFPGMYTFFLDRPPSKVVGVATTGISDSEIQVAWLANSESDIQTYNVYGSMSSGFVPSGATLLGSVSGVEFNHTGLSTGQTWFYVVTAEDNNVEGEGSDEVNETVQDFTEPIEPVIDPVTGSVTPTTTPSITIDYTAGMDTNVSVEITSGAVVVETFSGSDFYTWIPTLTPGTIYFFTIESCDEYLNCRQDEYNIMAETNLSFESEVIVGEFINYADMIQIIGSAEEGSYWLYQINLRSNGIVEDSFRPFFIDFTGITNILIPEDSQPISFCHADMIDYDVSPTPTYNVYDVYNTHDLGQSGLNCVNEGLTSIYETRHMVKMPIPPFTLPGLYGGGFGYYYEKI